MALIGDVVMAATLHLKSIVIERDVPKVGAERGNRANVHLVISGLGSPIETTLQIFDFSSLDDAVERARQVVYEFAVELAKVADQRPLR
jgi:hypothetical protein